MTQLQPADMSLHLEPQRSYVHVCIIQTDTITHDLWPDIVQLFCPVTALFKHRTFIISICNTKDVYINMLTSTSQTRRSTDRWTHRILQGFHISNIGALVRGSEYKRALYWWTVETDDIHTSQHSIWGNKE